MTIEINVFIGKGIGHIKYTMPDELDAYDDEGNEIRRPATISDGVAAYGVLVEALAAAGHDLGRQEMPQRGGGSTPRAEVPPPAGVPVPVHCGQDCEFKPAFTNPRNQKQISAKFQCRNNACPDKAGTGYAWSVFLDRWMKQQQEGQ